MKKIHSIFLFVFLLTSILDAQEDGITVKQNNVGIGTTDPQTVLHIDGQIAPELVIEFDDTTGGYGEFQLRDQNAKKWSIGTSRNSSTYPNSFYIWQYTDSINSSVNKQRFTIGNQGNVGIGTQAPAYQLHMQGTSNRIAQFESTNGGATQLRLKSTSSSNRRLIGESDTQVKNQISFENNDLKIYGQTASTNPVNIRTDGTNNVGFNQISSFGTSANGVIGIGEGTAPTTSPANMIQLYADNTTSSSAELKVRDEAGNVTILSNSQLQNLSYTAGTRQLNISSGTGATLPLFTSSQAGLSPASGGDTTKFLRADGTWKKPQISSGLSSITTSNFNVTSNTTLANIPNLSCNVEAGKTYALEAVLFTSGGSGGTKVAISGSATSSSTIYSGYAVILYAGIQGYARSTSLGGAVVTSSYNGGDINITGTVQVSASGTLTVQFAQGYSNATASTVLAGSFFKLTPISN
ncbi:MAG: hypothetical protein IPL46_30585 [Saprospiraceae bacterium]|nr:hypothetical protein [Saprospiraceae bacterium]